MALTFPSADDRARGDRNTIATSTGLARSTASPLTEAREGARALRPKRRSTPTDLHRIARLETKPVHQPSLETVLVLDAAIGEAWQPWVDQHATPKDRTGRTEVGRPLIARRAALTSAACPGCT